MDGIGTTAMDEYTVCLLAWMYGETPEEVLEFDGWTQANIDLAQKHCQEKHVDPIEYWKER